MRSPHELPRRLGKEPLVDVIFEMRFTGEGAEHVLPGILYSKLQGDKSIEALPFSAMLNAMPAEMRRGNPKLLAGQPTTRVRWKRYKLLFGDGIFAISCVLPYPGWAAFKPDIVELVGHVMQSGIAKSVTRLALKYVDLFDGDDVASLRSKLNAELSIGGMPFGDRPFQFGAELRVEDTSVQVAIGAPANVLIHDSGAQRKGLVLTVDAYVETQLDSSDFSHALADSLDRIHLVNKQVFFSCLTDHAIEEMEPER
jgi:uncharacterized protein (TIGR04255 family)